MALSGINQNGAGGLQQAQSVPPSPNGQKANTIPEGLINYNDEFKDSDPILFRDHLISEMYAVLLAKQKPNVLLVGPAGSGKTALAQEIGREIANKEQAVPSELHKMTVYELPLSSLVAGSAFVGALEEKVNAIVNFAETTDSIIFIDEIHLLINSHNSSYSEIAQILKPALARGKMHVIGATTTQEARDLLADPAFNRRFSQINVNEITQEQELTLLQKALPSLSKHYHNKVVVPPDLLETVVTISDEVLRPRTHRPDSGLTLLDRVMGEAIANQQYSISVLQKANNTVAANAIKKINQIQLDSNMIEQTATKIVSGMESQPTLNKQSLADALAPVMYQDDAKEKISKLLLTNQLGIFNPEQPLSMLLVGSSGVGKTMISRLVANYVTNTEPIVLNMAEYNSDMALTRILGSSAGYVGSDSHAELPFDILDSNPYQVILLDEFDQSSPAVQRLFMRVLDEGKLQLANNHMIDFSKSIIFITTNGNNSNFGEHTVGFNQESQADATEDLRSVFEDKVINRFSAVIRFNSLTREQFIDIMKENYADLIIKLRHKVTGLPDELSDDELNELADKFYRPEFGARPAKKALEYYVQNKM